MREVFNYISSGQDRNKLSINRPASLLLVETAARRAHLLIPRVDRQRLIVVSAQTWEGNKLGANAAPHRSLHHFCLASSNNVHATATQH